MSKTFMTGQTCEDTLRQLDLFIDKQLPEIATAGLLKHIETCPSCYEELELRRRVRSRLRTAVATTPAPYLQTKVLASVRSEAAKQRGGWHGWQRQITAAAAMFIVCIVTGGIAYNIGHLRWTEESRESYVNGLVRRVSTAMGVGLGDHIHCTVQHRAPKLKALPKAEEVANELPSEYKNLLPAVMQQIPPEYRLFVAHSCRYHKRQFHHLSFKNADKLVSVIVVRKQAGEAFDPKEVTGALAQTGLPMYASPGVQRFQIAGFQSRDHLAYIVSDMRRQDNINLMLALAPGVSSFLAKLES